MGLTIHFEGRLVSQDNFQKVIDCAVAFANENDMPWLCGDVKNAKLYRYEEEKLMEYESSLKGVIILPDPRAEPLCIQFDNKLYLRQFCKTVYADISVHILIVDLLRKIQPYFIEFIVTDESGYWETGDITILQDNFDSSRDAIDIVSRILGAK